MINPFSYALQAQQAMAVQMLSMSVTMFSQMVKLSQLQASALTHSWVPHRAEDLHIHIKPEKHTAVLTHHYGRRHTDVDVEHMR
ncbi:MAG: hypothetical protein H6907_07315 [Hyphomicrobiales bacterium]|nr:hypothetical protein [Hyphomicrobiales bacterium]MCP5371531.1 hypothetical protein [Hyphomicrobiales bacterium]